MSYSGPPGVSGNSSHPSLPPRPPQPSNKPSSGFKPAFSAAPTTYSSTPSSYGAPPSYGTAGPRQYGAAPTTSAAPYSSYPSAPPSIGASYQQPPASYNTYQAAPQTSYPGQPQAYYGAAATGSYSTPPAIRNPFPAPAGGGAHAAQLGPDLDPDTAAQIAQWQSAYMPKDASAVAAGDPTAANGARGAGRYGAAYNNGAAAGPQAAGATIGVAATPTAAEAAAAAAHAAAEKKKTVMREGGGKKWADDSLLEWDPSHLRLFVGNLAGETTDESLLKAFSRWSSVQKAKVVRDKRTTKSKGYGFVSFSDPDDFFQAAKEMNGKYIQSHPVVVHKAKTEIKPQVVKDNKRQGKNKGNWKNKQKSGGGGAGDGHQSGSGMGKTDGAAAGYEPHLGPHGGGVRKPGQKTRDGLKILG